MAHFTQDKPESDWRTYHLRVPVRSYFWEAVRGESTFGREPKPAPGVALEVGTIKGIQSFYVREGYELVIHKAGSYTWEEIESALHTAVDDHNQFAEWPEQEEIEPAPVELEQD